MQIHENPEWQHPTALSSALIVCFQAQVRHAVHLDQVLDEQIQELILADGNQALQCHWQIINHETALTDWCVWLEVICVHKCAAGSASTCGISPVLVLSLWIVSRMCACVCVCVHVCLCVCVCVIFAKLFWLMKFPRFFFFINACVHGSCLLISCWLMPAAAPNTQAYVCVCVCACVFVCAFVYVCVCVLLMQWLSLTKYVLARMIFINV